MGLFAGVRDTESVEDSVQLLDPDSAAGIAYGDRDGDAPTRDPAPPCGLARRARVWMG
jgi:hypothetical protein